MNLQTYPLLPFDAFASSVCGHITHTLKEAKTSVGTTYFHADNLCSLSKCVTRILKYAPSSTESVVIALAYLERVESLTFSGFVNPVTANRLFLTALLIASKFNDDVAYPNRIYSSIVGMDLAELNLLEVEMLFRLHFRLCVTEGEYAGLCERLMLPPCKRETDVSFTVSRRRHVEMVGSESSVKEDLAAPPAPSK